MTYSEPPARSAPDGAVPVGVPVFDDGVPAVANLDPDLLGALRRAATDAATDAADDGVGPVAARAWLSEHGAGYGLCQIYRNEPWHYELHTDAIEHGCPPMYADPAHDPRTQR